MKSPAPILAVVLLSFVVSCAPEEEVIRVKYLKSECAYCRMIFQDKEFGAQMQMDNDSVLVFDATECLAAHLISERLRGPQVKRIWSVDYSRPTKLVDARQAYYIRTDKILSPMSVNIAAFGSKSEADSAFARLGGERMDWRGVKSLVDRLWYHNRANPDSLP